MTPEEFCQTAMALPETEKGPNKERVDFQVRGKVFASLFPEANWAVAKMDRQAQAELTARHPRGFRPCKGAWGLAGATIILLGEAGSGQVLKALASAWEKAAPADLAKPCRDNRPNPAEENEIN